MTHFLSIPRVLACLFMAICGMVCCVQSGSAAESMQYPLAVAASSDGTIFAADRYLPGVWQYREGKWSILFQGSKKFRTPLNAPRSLAIGHEGALLAGDSATRDVYRFEGANPKPLTDRGEGYGEIGIPMGIACAPDGELFVSDLELHRIVKVSADGKEVSVLAEVPAPRGLCLDDQGRLWVISGRKLLRVSAEGKSETVVDEGTFEFPHTVVVQKDGTALVVDGYAKAVWRVPADGKPEKWIEGDPFVNPVGLALHGENVLVADPHAKSIFQIAPDGKVTPVGGP